MNTTSIAITCAYYEDKAIKYIQDETNLPIKKYSDATKCGGPKIVIFDIYGACVPCIGKEFINQVVQIFKKAPWEKPEFAVLFLIDDNTEREIVVTHFDVWEHSIEIQYPYFQEGE